MIDESYWRKMITIRQVEARLQGFCDTGLAGDLHFNKGQEAISVGVCAALESCDHIVTHHRTIAHEIARGADLHGLIAEVLGKRTGFNGGRAGEMHISNKKIGHEFSFQLVGTCIPVACGLAWALKYHHLTGEVVAVFFGDAATSNGQFHEGLSIAAIHKLPLLLVCENNHRAGNIDPRYYLPTSIESRAAGYGIESATADGNDLGEVIKMTRSVLPRVRRGEPFLIEFDTTRLCWHKQGQRDVRSPIELAEEARRDPLKSLPTYFKRIEAVVSAELDEVFQAVTNDPPAEFP